MRRLFQMAVMVALVAGVYFFFQHFEIVGLDQVSVRRKTLSATPVSIASGGLAPAVDLVGDTIRIASFNIQVFGDSKASKPQVMEVLAEVVRRFDVVAIQEIRAKNQQLLPAFVDRINATGRHYDYVIGRREGRTSSKEQYAFVFDTASIEVDRGATYSIEDPSDFLHRPPLVSAFRARGPPTDQAFTFSLINIHTDPDETDQELDALDDVFREVMGDGRGEDDVILLGDLNVDDEHLGELGEVPGAAWMISGVATNTRGTKLYDNIVYRPRSTTEFTGRAGVFDLMREFNLTMEQALQVSDHLPVWAEFSAYENGPSGRVAAQPDEPAVR